MKKIIRPLWLGVIQKGREQPCWSGHPIGQTVLLAEVSKGGRAAFGTRFSRESLVCYTFCNRRRLKGIEASFLSHFMLTATRKMSVPRTIAVRAFFVCTKRYFIILSHSEKFVKCRGLQKVYTALRRRKRTYKNISFLIFSIAAFSKDLARLSLRENCKAVSATECSRTSLKPKR